MRGNYLHTLEKQPELELFSREGCPGPALRWINRGVQTGDGSGPGIERRGKRQEILAGVFGQP